MQKNILRRQLPIEKRCDFGIDLREERTKLPSGYHVTGKKICPRNLSPEMYKETDPSGSIPCQHYDQEQCIRAFSEELHCPTRGERRRRALRGLI